MAQYTLDGSEKKIKVLGLYASIKNNSGTVIYAGQQAGIDPSGTNVTPIQAGESVVIPANVDKCVYLLGTGDIAVISGNERFNFFKPAPKDGSGGGGTGGDGITQQQFTDTLKLYETIASSDNKLKNKADKSEIPTSLPADGGNAATVGGLEPYELGTLNASGTSHGDNLPLMCRWNYPANGYFSLFIGSDNNHANPHPNNFLIRVNYADNANNANNAEKLGNKTLSQVASYILNTYGGKHNASQGKSGGYSFVGDGSGDTGMFSDSDGDLYFMENGTVIHMATDSDIVELSETINNIELAICDLYESINKEET